MNDLFLKPYCTENENAAAPRFPYSRELLSEGPVFPAYVYDGGASFFQLDLFGDNDSDAMLSRILSGELFSYWTLDGQFDWGAVFKKFSAFGCTAEWEAHLWLNRLYLLLPLAQAYLRTGDRAFSEKWFSLLSGWAGSNPYTTYEDRPDDMVWRDMQVAWRTINLVHSVFMLGSGEALTKEQWTFVYDLIRLHAEHLLKEGEGLAEGHMADNHHLQIGMALIMTGVLFPEFGKAALRIDTGRQIVKDNLDLSIFDDGVNNEDSPSYSHFIARLYTEAELFLTKNGLPGIPGCAEKIRKQYAFLHMFSSPDGKTLQIGDSYVMDAEADIRFVSRIFPLFRKEAETGSVPVFPAKGSCLFPESRMAVLRLGKWSVYVDAMDMKEWHQHYGRPNFLVFYGNETVIPDSGCVNYDRYDLRCLINSAEGHNVVACEEMPLEYELEMTDTKESLSVTERSFDGLEQRLTVENRVTSPDGRSYLWTRSFLLTEGGLTVTDTVRATEPMHFRSILHLASARVGYYDSGCTIGNTRFARAVQAVSADRRTANQRYGGTLLTVACDSPFTADFMPCSSVRNRMDYTKVLTRRFYTDRFTETTRITASELPA